MTRIESGPARTDALYHVITFLFFLAVGGWFLYDWQIGYPKKNRAEAIEKLHQFVEDPALQDDAKAADLYDRLGVRPTEEDFTRLARKFESDGNPTTTEAIRKEFGDPTITRTVDDRQLEIWLSKTGGLKAEFKDSRLQPIVPQKSWRKWGKSHDEVENQKWWALIPFLLSLFFLFKLVKALSLRASLDDREFVYGGTRVPLERIQSLEGYNPKGWIDVFYLDAANERRKLRLDNQKIARFDELVAGLCRAKGVADPIVAHRATQPDDDLPKV